MTKKRIGPNFVPWGTPAAICIQFEVNSPSLTHCLRFDRKLMIHSSSDLLSPSSISLLMRTLLLMRSKALEKSKMHMRRYWPGESR